MTLLFLLQSKLYIFLVSNILIINLFVNILFIIIIYYQNIY